MILGDDELAKGRAVLRDMTSKEQEEMFLDELEAVSDGEEGKLMAERGFSHDPLGDWKRSSTAASRARPVGGPGVDLGRLGA